jgi:6,7-dimethyl-8-ribityllumazine synthase
MAGTVSLPVGKVDTGWKIAIVRSAWHPECVDPMVTEAKAELTRLGVPKANVFTVEAPGSFEVPLLCQWAIRERKADAVIAFGVIVQGQTHHARIVAEQAAAGIMKVQLETGAPIAFEILFVDDVAHAKARSTGEHGKGPLAARTVLISLAKLKHLG